MKEAHESGIYSLWTEWSLGLSESCLELTTIVDFGHSGIFQNGQLASPHLGVAELDAVLKCPIQFNLPI